MKPDTEKVIIYVCQDDIKASYESVIKILMENEVKVEKKAFLIILTL